MTHAVSGLWPAMLMPVSAQGAIDTPRAIAHAKRLIAAGSDGLTLFGTTGEGPAFTVAERKGFVEALLAAGVRGQQMIITLTASALADAIDLGRHAMRIDAKATMLLPPYYFNQPRERGVVEAVAQVVAGIDSPKLKLLLYHFPSLANVSFGHTAIAELARRFPDAVVGVKDSTGDLPHSLALVRAFPQLSILVGCEPHVAPTMLVGGAGSVNGLANIAPQLMRRVIDAPDSVSAADASLMQGLLALLGVQPNMPFVSAYKCALAEQTGDDTWMNVRAPLDPLDNTEAQAVRLAYRALRLKLEDA